VLDTEKPNLMAQIPWADFSPDNFADDCWEKRCMYFVLTREEEDFKESFGGAWGYYWNLLYPFPWIL
jgi:hypothetical protein